MTYIDGFVAAVPTANRDAYRKHAEMAAPVFKQRPRGVRRTGESSATPVRQTLMSASGPSR